MLEKLKENRGKIVGNFSAVMAGMILAGVIGTAMGETMGAHSLFLYLFGMLGHSRLSQIVEKKVSK